VLLSEQQQAAVNATPAYAEEMLQRAVAAANDAATEAQFLDATPNVNSEDFKTIVQTKVDKKFIFTKTVLQGWCRSVGATEGGDKLAIVKRLIKMKGEHEFTTAFFVAYVDEHANRGSRVSEASAASEEVDATPVAK
jgi:hypothetical protein